MDTIRTIKVKLRFKVRKDGLYIKDSKIAGIIFKEIKTGRFNEFSNELYCVDCDLIEE